MKYKITNLNDKTPQAEQNKLVSALKGVQGVQSAKLDLGTQEVEVIGRDKKDPARNDLSAAANKAGFTFAAK